MLDKEYDYKDINTERKSGVILHISSLASDYGIGTLGKKAYEYCDFLEKSGFHYWQILPIGPTSYGDSPYQSFSSFAGNPYFIDLDLLCYEKLLEKSEYENIDFGDNKLRVDYAKLYNNRFKVLKIAYKRFTDREKLDKFVYENRDWLEDYALFMALKNHFDSKAWINWDEDIKNREEKALLYYKTLLKDDIDFQYFLQYKFYEQYLNLKKYVNNKNIEIVGDLPIYCAYDSADVWINKEEFDLNFVGGCPPDDYSSDGQLWGNPTYNWEYMENNGYKWWINRIEKTFKLFDVLRIDHFRGFESYWAVPSTSDTSADGSWKKGPDIKLFNKIFEKLGRLNIIAEDLGYTTKEVVKFRKATGLAGMKMMQFAFDPNNESDFLPHNIERNWAVYPSTHDSDTIKSWIDNNENNDNFLFAKKYLNLTKEEGYVKGFIRGAWSTVANVAITQMQDFLEQDNEYRMNTPSTLGNWTYRLDDSLLTDKLAKEIYDLNKTYSRLNRK